MQRRPSFRFALFACFALVAGLACSSSADSPTPSTDPVGAAIDALVTATGVDYSYVEPRPSPSGLRAGGYAFAARYLSHPGDAKNLTKAEAQALWAAGVDVVSNWEYGGWEPLDGYDQGVADAKVAAAQAFAAGMPSGRPIYFSVDVDATADQETAINAYFDGVASVLGRTRTGAYAGYWVIKRLFDAGKITWGWQTAAWSGGNWDSRAQLRQVQFNVTAAGSVNCCDKDQAMTSDYGQWHAGPPPPPLVSCVNNPGVGNNCGDESVIAGGVATSLYHCAGAGAATLLEACAHGCLHQPPGIDDACNHAACVNDPGVGNNCGDESVISGGDARFLYRCNGAGPAAVLARCDRGCQHNPPGVDDACL